MLLLVCGWNCALVGVCGGKKEIVHKVSVTGQKDLEFRSGDNPCKVLRKYCKSLEPQISYSACHGQLHPLVLQQITQLWRNIQSKLKVEAGFFIDCEPIDMEELALVSAENGVEFSARNSSAVITELLVLLERALERDSGALQTFNVKRNELKLTDIEKVELYRKAILLLPNNLFIVDQFGLALMFVEREESARKLFSNAVARGLWGNPLQRPVSKYVAGLTSKPWHNPKDYHFIAALEAGYSDIREELEKNLKEKHYLFTEEQENLHVGGDWTELRLKSSGYGFTKHTEHFPKTMRHIRECGEEFTSIKLSAIQPGTHIRTHTGPSNERLRVHLALIHTGGARIRVAVDWHTWEEGRAIVFDDSWEHEVLHTGPDMRVVLILDIWHPELPVEKRIAH